MQKRLLLYLAFCLPAIGFSQTITDAEWLDSDGDGNIDQVTLTFSENMDVSDLDGAGGTGLDCITISGATIDNTPDYTATNIATLTLDISDITGTATPANTITYSSAATNSAIVTNAGATEISDGEISVFGGTYSDGAAPAIIDFEYQDNDNDGIIDQFLITFSEALAAASNLEANDLSLSNVSDFTSAAFGTNTTNLLGAGGETNVVVVLGTPATVEDTEDNGGTLEVTTQNTFSLTDGTNVNNALVAQTHATFSDGAAPILVSAEYLDTDADGIVDRIDATFSEDISGSTYEAADWSLPSNPETLSISGGVVSGTDMRLTITGAPADDTSLGATTVQYTDGSTTGSITDGSNDTPTSAVTTVDDGAAPVIVDFEYQDNNNDGAIDQFLITFSEALAAASNLEANDLSLSNVSDFTSAAFGTNTTNLLGAGGETSVTVVLGTPASVEDTEDNGGTLEVTTQNTFSLSDGTNINNGLAAQTQASFSDGAAPILVSAEYLDTDADGTVDRIDATFSEDITGSTYEASDWSLPSNPETLSISGGVVSGSDMRLTVSGAPADDTSLGATTVQYTDGSTTGSITDGSNDTPTSAVTTVDDGAAPVIVDFEYQDNNNDGAIDQFLITFSEALAAASNLEANDLSLSNVSDFTSAAFGTNTTNLLGAGGETSVTVVLGTPASVEDTEDNGGTLEVTTQNTFSLSDGTNINNGLVAQTQASFSDGAAPILVSAEYLDTDADGTVDRIDATFSEDITGSAYEAGDWTLPANPETLSISGGVVSGTDMRLTITGAPTDDTSLGGTTIQYVDAATTGSVTDGANDTPTSAITAVTDGAAPVIVDFEYQDNDSDGAIDQFLITFSEALDAASNLEANDLSLSNVSDFTSASFGTNTTNLLGAGGETNIVVVLGTPASVQDTEDNGGTLEITTQNTFSLSDGTNVNSVLAAQTQASFTDGAAPVISDFEYQDNNNDGAIDQFLITFSEALDAASNLEANDLSLSNVSDFTSAAFGTNTTNLLGVGGETSVTVVLGTPATVEDTEDNGGTLEVTTQNTFSLSDGTNVNNALVAQTQASFSDGAAPILISSEYLDTDANGVVDRIDVTFSEDITGSAYEAADWSLPANPETLSISGGVVSGTDVQLTVTGAPADNTALGGTTIQYADAATTGSITDGSNDTPTSAITAVTDGAAPIIVDFEYRDNDTNGTIDRVLVSFSETLDAASVLRANDLLITNVGDFTSAAFGTNTTDLVTGAVSSVEVVLGTPSSVVDTEDGSGNFAISTQNLFSLTDGTNTNSSLGAQTQATVSDGASPVITGYSPSQGATGVAINTNITMTFSEDVTDQSTGDITLEDITGVGADDRAEAALTIDIGVATSNEVVINPNADLTNTNQYSVSVPGTRIDDGSGNFFAGLNGTTDYNFTTVVPTPTISDVEWLDSDGDGNIDQVTLTFSANVDIADGDDAGGTGLDCISISGGVTIDNTPNYDNTNIASITLDITDITGTATPSNTVTYDGTATNSSITSNTGSVEILDGEVAANGGTYSDGADPVIIDFEYRDNNSDGQIDRILVTFSETLDAASTLSANDLNITNAGDFTSAAFGTDGTDLITGAVSSVEVTLGTSSSVQDTEDDIAASFAISTQNAFSLTDGTNTNSTTGAQTQATITDGAPPVVVDLEIFDAGGDGLIERIDITFSENVDTDDSAPPVLADLGTLTLPDGTNVSNGGTSISDPAGGTNVVSVTGIVDQATIETGAGSTAIDGLTGLWVDATGNAIIATGDDSESIIDSALPILIDRIPAHTGSAGIGTNIDLVFSEVPALGTGNITVTDEDDGSSTQAMNVTGGVIDGDTVTIDITSDLEYSTNYSVQIDATAIDDAAGNSYAGIANNTDYTFSTVAPAFLSAGDIAFVGWDADDNDNFAIVALTDLDGSSTPFDIRFTDNEWDGTSAFISGEGEIIWTVNVLVSAGTIIEFNDVNTGTPSVTAGSVARTGSFLINTSNEAVFAYIGSGLTGVSAVLAGISSDDIAGWGSLANSGLVEGTTAIDFDGVDDDLDVGQYTGRREGAADFADYLFRINDPNEWFTNDGGGTQTITFNTTAFTIDTDPPNVTSITPSPLVVSDPDVGASNFSVVVLFDEPMDGVTAPTISFNTDVVGTGTLTFNSGGWSTNVNTNDTYTATYDVADVNELVTDINISVISAVDSVGNTQVIADTELNEFTVDTDNPAFTAAHFFDTDEDGTIDEIVIEMDEEVDETSVEFGDFTLGAGSVTSVSTVASTNVDNSLDTSDSDQYVTLEVSVPGTATVTVAYAGGASGFLADANGNIAADDASITTVDVAAPVIAAASTVDADADGFIDGLTITLSENINDGASTLDGTTFDVTGFSGEGVTTGSANDNELNLTFTEAVVAGGDTDAAPDVTLNLGTLSDGSNTTVGNQLFSGTTDGAAPAIVDLEIQDTDNNALIDQLVVTFSENVETFDGFAPDITDFGTIVLPDGSNVTAATVSDPGGTSPTVTLSAITNQATENSGVGSTAISGVTNQWSDGTNQTSDPDNFVNITDGASPTISVTNPTNPVDGASENSASLTSIAIVFDEDVQAGTGNIEIYADMTPFGQADLLVYQAATSTGTYGARTFTTDEASFDVSSVTFSSGITYYVNLDAGAIEDGSSNGYAGISDETTWNFTINAETNDPVVTNRNPADNSSNVDITTDFTITFDEPVFQGVGSIELRYSGTNNLVESVDVSTVAFVGNTATISFTNDLSGQTQYYILIPDGAIVDNNANTFNGYSTTGGWNFFTESGTDVAAPLVTAINPLDAATGVGINPTISITFNEPVVAGTGNFYIRDGGVPHSTLDVSSDISISGNTVSFSPSSNLDYNTAYTIDWDAGALEDNEGNGLAIIGSQSVPADGTWNFTTLADVTAPTLVTITPANDATGISSDPTTISLIMNFSEPVNLGTGSVEIYYNDGTTLFTSENITGGVLSNADSTITLALSDALDGATEYYVSIASGVIEDKSGNAFAGVAANGSWSFTTTADAVAPVATPNTPAHTSTGFDLSGNLVVDFSEKVYAGSGNITITSASQTLTIPATDGTQVSGFGTTQLTINPNVELFSNEAYTVSFGANAIEDASGVDATVTWSFSTETGVTVTAPAGTLCTGGDFTAISNIVIAETSSDNFRVGASQTIVLQLPVDHKFNTAVGNIGVSGADISGEMLTVNETSLTITYSISGSASTDQITIGNLEIQYNGSSALSNQLVLRSGTGTADMEGNQDYHDLTFIDISTSVTPAAPDITPAPVGSVTTEMDIADTTASAFNISWSGGGGSSYRWVNDETSATFDIVAANSTTSSNLPGFNLNASELYTYYLLENDGTCVSDSSKLNIFVSDILSTSGTTSFFDNDADGDTVSVFLPTNHTIAFSGNGTINLTNFGGYRRIRFIPENAGIGTHDLNVVVTNNDTGESYTYVRTYTVNSAASIFNPVPATDYCNNGTSVSIVPYTSDIVPNYGPGSQFYAFDAPAGVSGTLLNTADWTFNPSGLAPGSTSNDLVIRRIIQNGSGTKINAGFETFTVYPDPVVAFANLNTQYCEDDDLFALDITVDGSSVTVTSYDIIKLTGTGAPAGPITIVSDEFDPSDPLGNGTAAVGTYRIQFTSSAGDDPDGGCVVTENSTTVEIITKPVVPEITSGYDADLGDPLSPILIEYCEGETISNVSINTPGTDTYTWYNSSNAQLTVSATNGTFITPNELFGSASPANDTYEFYVFRTSDISAALPSGCTSDSLRIIFEIYENPDAPVIDETGSVVNNTSAAFYNYNYCEGDAIEDITLDLATFGYASADSSFVWLTEDKGTVITTANALGSVITTTEMGLPSNAGATDFDTTFFVVRRDFEDLGGSGFTGCPGDTTEINISFWEIPEAPDVNTFTTTFYLCLNQTFVDAFEQSFISTPDSSGMVYKWYQDAGGTPGAQITTTLNDRITESQLTTAGYDRTTAGTYTYWVSQTRAINSGESFNGCESAATEVTITVFGFEGQPTVDGNTDDGYVDDADVTYFYCAEDIAASESFLAGSDYSFGGDSIEFKWYRSNAARAKTQLISVDDQGGANANFATATANDLGIASFDSDQTRYFLVTQNTSIITSGVTHDGCESDGTLIKFNFYGEPPAPTVVGGPDIEYCVDDIVSDLVVTGEGNPGELFQWYDADLNSIFTGATATAGDLGISTTSDSVYTYFVTQVQDVSAGPGFGGCEGPSTEVTLTVYPIPVEPNITGDDDICFGDVIPTFEILNLETGATVEWFDVNLNSLNITSSRFYTPSITAQADSTYTFYAAQTNDEGGGFAGCTSDYDTATFTINAIPVAPTVTGNGTTNEYEYCAEDDVSAATLDITSPNGTSTYTWYSDVALTNTIATGSSVNFTDIDLALSSININTAGSTVIYVTETASGNCEGPSQTVTITINALPVLSFSGINSEYCYDDGAVTITGLNNSGALAIPANATFTINTGGLVDNGDGTATFTPTDAATAAGETRTGNASSHTITFSYTDGNGCSDSETFNVTVNPQPDLSISSSATVACWNGSDITLQGVADLVNVSSGTFSINTGGLTDNGNGTAVLNPRAAGTAAASNDSTGTSTIHTVTFDYTDGNGCQNSTNINITINPLPLLNIVYASDSSAVDGSDICFDNSAVTIRGFADGVGAVSGTFSINTGGLTDNGDGTASFDPEIAAIAAGETREGSQSSHTITFTYSDGSGCQNVVTANLNVNPQPTLGIEYSPTSGALNGIEVCYDESNFTIQGIQEGIDATSGSFSINTGGLTDNGDGTADIDGVTAVAAAGETRTGNVTTHTVTFTYTDGNGCDNSFSSTFTINPQPVLDIEFDATGDPLQGGEVCFDEDSFVIRGIADNTNTTSGTYSISNDVLSDVTTAGGLTDNGDGTATIDPSVAAVAAGQTRTGDASVHTVTYTYSDNNGCENVVSASFTINPQPELVIFDQTTSGDINGTEYCYDDTGIVFVPMVDGVQASIAANVSWKIEFSGTLSSGLTPQSDGTAIFNPSVAATAAGESRTGDESVFNITFEYTDGNGCLNAITSTVTVNPQPLLGIEYQSNGFDIDQTEVCFTDNAFVIVGTSDEDLASQSFTIATDNSSGGFVDNGDGTATFDPRVIALDNGQDTLDAAQDYDITFNFTDDNGCSNSITSTITINPLPDVNFVGEIAGDEVFTITDESFETCYGGSQIDLVAVVNGAPVTTGSWSSTGPGTQTGIVSQSGGEAVFSPSNARDNEPYGAAQTFTVTFTFQDINGCSQSYSKEIIVHPIPELMEFNSGQFINSDKACEDEEVIINIALNNMNTSDVQIDWYQGNSSNAGTLLQSDGGLSFTEDISSVVLQQPQRTYTVVVTNNITNCSREETITVPIGRQPVPKFSWENIIAGSPTQFVVTDSVLPNAIIEQLQFVITQGATTLLDVNPANLGDQVDYTFANGGVYTATLYTTSTFGCQTTESRSVNIIPTIQVTTGRYDADFNDSDNDWYTSNLSVNNTQEDNDISFWERGVPGGALGSVDGNAWVTVAGGNYPDDSRRGYFLYSPNYDLSAMEIPTISFDSRTLTVDGKDGAVLQYSVDGGQTWSLLGSPTDDPDAQELSSGVEWYNASLISGLNKDGVFRSGDNDNFIGWAGQKDAAGWVKSIHILPNSASSIMFRFFFGSNGDSETADGFAFDNFSIYESSKITILETFSSVYNDFSQAVNDTIEFRVNNQLGEVIWINYYGDFDNTPTRLDPLNARDRVAPGAMSTYYGINSAPYSVINGEVANTPDATETNGNRVVGWSNADIERVALIDPAFTIDISDNSTDPTTVNLEIVITSDLDFTQEVEINTRVLIVEDNYPASELTNVDSDQLNVVRKMLPSPDGFTEFGAFTRDQEVGRYNATWNINNVYGDTPSLRAVVYVQNEQTKVIYQAGSLELTAKQKILTGVEKQFRDGAQFALYPNPAWNNVNIAFEAPLQSAMQFELIDQTGKVLINGNIQVGDDQVTLDTSDLPQGIYFINVFNEHTLLKPRRLMVTHE